MKVIYAQQPIDIEGQSIFLAGPTPRSADVKSWRPEVIEELLKQGFKGTVFAPEMEGGWTKDFEYGAQIDWETNSLEACDVIIFWVPRDLKDMPAFTTNIEFGIWLEKNPNKIVLGWPEDAEKMTYIEYKAKQAYIKCHKDIKEMVKYAIYKTKYL